MSLNGNNVIGSSGHRTNQPPYEIDQSLRMENGDSANLSKTFSSAGSGKKWTLSCWAKIGELDTNRYFMYLGTSGQPRGGCYWGSSSETTPNGILMAWNGMASTTHIETSASYRDPAQWYHYVFICDTTLATAADRLQIWVNGSRVTDLATANYPSIDDVTSFSQTYAPTEIGGGGNFDGYLAEYHFLDDVVATAADFGETDSATNQWVPIKYEGSYGTNGFYLKFQDSSALGDDSSGNTNDFTSTNLAATDQVLDSPTNNFCTLNPLNLVTNTTLSEGNLKADCTSSNDGAALGTMSVSSGKWYWEVLQTTANANNDISMGVMELSRKMAPQGVGADVYPNAYLYGNDGWNAKYNSTTSTINTYGAGDIIGWALDLDGNTLKIYKNNSLEYTYSSGVSGTFTPLAAVDGTSGQSVTHIANFGQDSSFNGEKTAQGNGGTGEDFYYTPPTGFKALNTDNLSDPSIADPTAHFNTKLYTGTGSELAVTGVGFQPDFTWIKTRALTYNHRVFDVVRGVTKELYPNTTAAEVTDDPQTLKSFDSDGFTLGTSSGVNPSSTMVSWNWKAGGTASTNEDGSIDSSVSANTTAGFSIVSWTGTGSNVTVGHGLSQAPELIINKSRGDAYNWAVQSILFNSASDTNLLYLNTTAAAADDTNVFQAAPTATVFSPQGGSWAGIGTNTIQYIAYCFHSVEGYSKIGSYEGNANADGPFVYTGFRPAFLIVKGSSQAVNWDLIDAARNPYNILDKRISPNTTGADDTSAVVDFVSNGFKVRTTSGGYNDPSSATYIYLAFAESPFKTSNAR